MADDFAGYNASLDAPASRAAAITPNDSADLTDSARAIYIGGDGDVRLTTVNGDTVTFVGVKAGTVLPVRTRRVLSTSTTATGLVALR